MCARGVDRPSISEQIIRNALIRNNDMVLSSQVKPEQGSVLLAPFVEFEPAVEGRDVREIAYKRLARRSVGELCAFGNAVALRSEVVKDDQGQGG